MHLRSTGALALSLLLVTFASPCSAERVPAYVAAAIADPGRSAKSVSADVARKPAELLTFIGLKPGEKIVDVIPGLYFDQLFADVVGPAGHVFMFIPPEYAKADNWPIPSAGTPLLPGYANVTWTAAPISAFSTPEPVDVVWIRHNYHDLYDPFMGPADVPAFNKAVYKALKPGGRYVIIDHWAPDGSGLTVTNTTHRIDGEVVKKDVEAAGFIFVRESTVLRNPSDPRDKVPWDTSIQDKTDQFVYLFRKP